MPEYSTNSGPDGASAGAAGAALGPKGRGLVSLGTSDTVPIEEAHIRRLRRMRRGVLSSARLIEDRLTVPGFRRHKAAMVTLTYRPGVEWSPLHVAAYLKCVREWARRRGFPLFYVWVMELTKRGVPHYHVLFWLPRGYSMPKADKQGWWPHGHTKSEWARSPVGYLVKYASKGAYWDTSFRLPPGARLWGAGGLTRGQCLVRAWHMAPAWLRQMVAREDGVRRDPGGWWRNASTGWGYRSPWIVEPRLGVLRWVGWTLADIDIPTLDLGTA